MWPHPRRCGRHRGGGSIDRTRRNDTGSGPRWRRMAGASGPRAADRAGAPRSPSRCRRRRRRRTAPRPSPRRPPGDERARTSILVVDDDPHARRQMRDALAAAGYAPATAAGPGEVARLVAARQPALAVLDLVLPGADGIELMHTLPALAGLPVIFVSAYGRGETIARALEGGGGSARSRPCAARGESCSSAGRVDTLLRILAQASVSSASPLNARFVARRVEIDAPSLIELLGEDPSTYSRTRSRLASRVAPRSSDRPAHALHVASERCSNRPAPWRSSRHCRSRSEAPPGAAQTIVVATAVVHDLDEIVKV